MARSGRIRRGSVLGIAVRSSLRCIGADSAASLAWQPASRGRWQRKRSSWSVRLSAPSESSGQALQLPQKPSWPCGRSSAQGKAAGWQRRLPGKYLQDECALFILRPAAVQLLLVLMWHSARQRRCCMRHAAARICGQSGKCSCNSCPLCLGHVRGAAKAARQGRRAGLQG